VVFLIADLLAAKDQIASVPVPGSGLRVEDTTLVDAGGRRFVLAGVSDYLVPFYTSEDGGVDTALAEYTTKNYYLRDEAFRRMREAGVNTLRVPLGLATYKNDVYELGGRAGYVERVRTIVQSAHRAGLAVILGWWDDTYEPGVGWSPELFSMMRDVLAAVHGETELMIEPVNEPAITEWEPWRKDMATMVRFWRETLGYRGVLLLDTPAYSWTFEAASARSLQSLDEELLGGPAQVMFANHRYANNNTCFCGTERDTWTQEIEGNAADFPLIGTEYGWFNRPYSEQRAWNEQFFAYLAASAVPGGFNGASAFVWSWVDDNTMTTGDGLTLNDRGRQYQEYFLDQVNGAS